MTGVGAYNIFACNCDPAIGRFYSIDPIFNPATSPYAYCGNNPVNYVDPTGMAMMPNIYQDGTAREVPHGLGGYSGNTSITQYSYDPFYGGNTNYDSYWGGNSGGGSGGYLSNNGVWVSGLEMADGQRFNTWYSAYWNYGARNGISSDIRQSIAVIVNMLSTDYFDNIGRFIQEHGIMINIFNEGPNSEGGIVCGNADPYNPTEININTANSLGIIAMSIGHEAVHAVQFSVRSLRFAENNWGFEAPAFIMGNDIARVVGSPPLDLAKLKEYYKKIYGW